MGTLLPLPSLSSPFPLGSAIPTDIPTVAIPLNHTAKCDLSLYFDISATLCPRGIQAPTSVTGMLIFCLCFHARTRGYLLTTRSSCCSLILISSSISAIRPIRKSLRKNRREPLRSLPPSPLAPAAEGNGSLSPPTGDVEIAAEKHESIRSEMRDENSC
jgi:hypothetical protein